METKTKFKIAFEDGTTSTQSLKPVKTPTILEAYWVDDSETKINVLDFNTEAIVKIIGKDLVGAKVTLSVYESDSLGDDFIWKYDASPESDSINLKFDMTPSMFAKGGDHLANFYFTLEIDGNEKEVYCDANDDYLKVHIVRYVPGVLRALGLNKGAELQDEWFSRQPTDNPDSADPNLSIITMDWTLGFGAAKTVHDLMIAQKIWVNTAGKGALLSEIKSMIADNEVILPTEEGDCVSFGVFDNTIIPHRNRRVPKFDKYHYQERAYTTGMLDPLDDLIAALANFVFRMSAGGVITRNKTSYTIEVNKVATYVRDSFDYIDDGWSSQELGHWNIEDNKVSKLPGVGYWHIENSSYQDYRQEFDMGGDYRLYSDLHFTTTNDTFNVPLNEF